MRSENNFDTYYLLYTYYVLYTHNTYIYIYIERERERERERELDRYITTLNFTLFLHDPQVKYIIYIISNIYIYIYIYYYKYINVLYILYLIQIYIYSLSFALCRKICLLFPSTLCITLVKVAIAHNTFKP